MTTAFETKVFAAQDSLVELLEERRSIADNPLAPWAIDFGLPYKRRDRHIWVDETVDTWERGQVTSGLVSQAESFRITAFIYARLTGATPRTIRADIITAADEVTTVLGSSPFLGGVVMYAELIGGEYGAAFADEQGKAREAVLRLDIGCTAHVA